MDQDALFDLPVPVPLRKPKGLAPGTGTVAYADFHSTVRTLCADCCAIVHDDLIGKIPSGWAIRRARKVRTQNKVRTFLCIEHAQLRREIEEAVGMRSTS